MPAQNPSDLPGYAVTYFPGTPNPSQAQFVTVSGSQDSSNVDFALAPVPTARIMGTAVNSAGEPITGGLMLAPSQRSGAIFTASMGARISADGSFEFPNLAPGEYVVQAARGRMQPSVEAEFASQVVTVNGADVTGVVLRTSPGSTIAGRFSFDGGDPPRARNIDLSPVPTDFDSTPLAGGFMAAAEIHNDWTFDMAGVNGPRRLRLTRSPPGWSLKSILLNGTDITDTPLMFGTKEQSIRDVEVVLTSRVTVVSGSVTDGRSNLAPGAHVIVFARDRDLWYPASRFLAHATAGSDGSFSVRGLPPGDYAVGAVDRLLGDGKDDEWQAPELLDALARDGKSLTIIEGQQVTIDVKRMARER